jgi:predicted aspartyl protease
MKHPFERDPEGKIILVPVILNGEHKMKNVLDTGASHTAIDKNVLLIENFNLDNPIASTQVETSNGVIEVDVFELESLSAFGITRRNVQVQVYDFLAHDILSSYQGVLGLDFFEGTQFTVNMVENTIVVESLSSQQ